MQVRRLGEGRGSGGRVIDYLSQRQILSVEFAEVLAATSRCLPEFNWRAKTVQATSEAKRLVGRLRVRR